MLFFFPLNFKYLFSLSDLKRRKIVKKAVVLIIVISDRRFFFPSHLNEIFFFLKQLFTENKKSNKYKNKIYSEKAKLQYQHLLEYWKIFLVNKYFRRPKMFSSILEETSMFIPFQYKKECDTQ